MTRWLSDDDSSKQNWQWERPSLSLSLLPSLLFQDNVSMGEPHSQFAVYASAERQTCDHDLRKKHVVNF